MGLQLWTPQPPGPDVAKLPDYIKNGLAPGEIGMRLSHTGVPVTWGCQGTVVYTAADGLTACAYAAPTEGSNHFSCTGPTRRQLLFDDNGDNLTVGVGLRRIYFDSPGEDSEAAPAAPVAFAASSQPEAPPPPAADSELVKDALRRDQLPRPATWTRRSSMDNLGRIGEALSRGRVPKRCKADERARQPEPRHAASLFSQENGEFIGSAVLRYRTASIARRQLSKVFSARSFGCLAAILRSADGDDSTVDTVQVKRLDVHGRPGERALGLQLLVSGTARGDGGWREKIDVIGLGAERKLAVVMSASDDVSVDSRSGRRLLRLLHRRL